MPPNKPPPKKKDARGGARPNAGKLRTSETTKGKTQKNKLNFAPPPPPERTAAQIRAGRAVTVEEARRLREGEAKGRTGGGRCDQAAKGTGY